MTSTSPLKTANTGTLKAAATQSIQGSATTTGIGASSNSNHSNEIVTRQQAVSVYGRAITDKQFKDLNDCLHRFEINTLARIQHFLSQTAHESGGLRWMEELANGSAYERRRDLGNISPGDGRKFKGAGVIQLTGRYNYQKFADFIGNPKVMLGHTYVAQEYPFTSAGFWWKNNKMNALCDQGKTCRQISAKVNGRDPANGLPDRERYYKKACQVIKQLPSHSSAATLQPAKLPATPVQFASIASPKSIITSVDPLDIQLSSHFKLREFVYSQTAIQKHINNTPPPHHIVNLKRLCETILEPARVALGPLRISSGYRSQALNSAIKGSSKTSAHMQGYAADVIPLNATKLEFARWVQKNCQFDQILLEFGTRQDPSWIHVSCGPGNRKEVFRISNADTEKVTTI